MEKYKIGSYDPETLVRSEIETPFSKELVKKLETFLEGFEGSKWSITPMMIKPEDLSLTFGIIEGKTLKYRITLSENK